MLCSISTQSVTHAANHLLSCLLICSLKQHPFTQCHAAFRLTHAVIKHIFFPPGLTIMAVLVECPGPYRPVMSAVTSDQLWTGEVETAKVSFNAHEVSHGVTMTALKH